MPCEEFVQCEVGASGLCVPIPRATGVSHAARRPALPHLSIHSTRTWNFNIKLPPNPYSYTLMLFTRAEPLNKKYMQNRNVGKHAVGFAKRQ